MLILVTGLFAAAWSTDRPPAKSNILPTPQHSYPLESVRETALHRWPVSRREPMVNQSSEWTPTVVASSPTDTSLKLQTGLDFLAKDEIRAAFTNVITKNWLEFGQFLRQEHAEFIIKQQKLALWRRMISPKSEGVTR